MRGKRHSDEVRAQVMAALLAGQGIAEVAKEYQLPEPTVREWANKSPEFTEVRTKKGEHLDSLIFEYLAANLAALTEQTRVASDPTYLKQQSADNLAVLHGVMADKAVRILGAAERAREAAAERVDHTDNV